MPSVKRAVLAFAAAGVVVWAAIPAHACSFDMRPVRERVEMIKSDPEVRRVKGVFRWEEVRGEPMDDPKYPGWLRDAKILGRVETLGGSRFETVHPAPDQMTTCYVGAYFKPETDASGIFYISRKKTDGRYELLHWEAADTPQD